MIILYSPKFIAILEKIYWNRSVNAASFWPFIILKFKDHPKNDEWINHETTHLKQQTELLIIGFIFWYFCDFIYRVLFKKCDTYSAYKANPFEREAYENQKNGVYNERRKHYSFLSYY